MKPSKPICFGRTGQTIGGCKQCVVKHDCHAIVDTYKQFKTVYELANPVEDEIQPLSLNEAVTLCQTLCKKYCPVVSSTNYPAFREALSKVLIYCKSEGINPRLYLESQYCMLSLFCKGRGSVVYPNMLLGKNAAARYWKHVLYQRRRFNTSTQKETQVSPWYTAEVLYGETLLRTKELGVRITPTMVDEHVRRTFSRWDRKSDIRKKYKNKALAHVLEGFKEGLSKQLYLKAGGWTWASVADILAIIIPPIFSTRLHTELDSSLGDSL